MRGDEREEEREEKGKSEAWNGLEKNRTSVEKLLSTRVISFAKLSNFKVLPRKPRLVNKKRLGTGKTSLCWTCPFHAVSNFQPQIELQSFFFLHCWIISDPCSIHDREIYLISFVLILILKCRKNCLHFRSFLFISKRRVKIINN